ncbi:uncharacterized protein LOC126906634 [Daktulosphaira vitifoliae]|uniref:uncharacterized protein LOC126906634 n=1 Tax=Daktulosphaira vitifoliae TaxID=58002 RepID=UPI0021A9DD55|nr:uncharacterized protein LOC126906634 [Daktulosphaira vitifoliae]
MFSLRLVNFYFLLFSVIFYTKALRSLKKNVNQLDTLLTYSGWKNLNDVHFIKYCKTTYYLQNLIKIPTPILNGDKKIRALSIYLGCSYAKIMNYLFVVISIVTKICDERIKQEEVLIDGFICTEELINIISRLIVPMAIMMKGSMDALDLLHNKPWTTSDRPYYLVNPLLGKIGNILDDLNKPKLSRDDRSIYYSMLENLYVCCHRTLYEINIVTKNYCEFVPYDMNCLWEDWYQEYKALIDQNEKLFFIKFLTKKIKDYTKTVIREKYFHLGFKFDPITEETFIPTPKEPKEPDLEFIVEI